MTAFTPGLDWITLRASHLFEHFLPRALRNFTHLLLTDIQIQIQGLFVSFTAQRIVKMTYKSSAVSSHSDICYQQAASDSHDHIYHNDDKCVHNNLVC